MLHSLHDDDDDDDDDDDVDEDKAVCTYMIDVYTYAGSR
jgi:hypothetical protein